MSSDGEENDEYFYDDDDDGFGQGSPMSGGEHRAKYPVACDTACQCCPHSLLSTGDDSMSEPDVYDILSPTIEGAFR